MVKPRTLLYFQHFKQVQVVFNQLLNDVEIKENQRLKEILFETIR